MSITDRQSVYPQRENRTQQDWTDLTNTPTPTGTLLEFPTEDSPQPSTPTRTPSSLHILRSRTPRTPTSSKQRVSSNKGKKMSFVWKYITKDDSALIYYCNQPNCSWSISVKTSTSNIMGHLEKEHGITKTSSTQLRSPTRSITQAQQATKNIVRLFINQNLPFSLIETDDFKRVVETKTTLFSATTLTRKVDDEFIQSRNTLITFLETSCCSISLSLDAWKSVTQEHFIGIIGHWIDTDFKYNEQLLDFREGSHSHTGENMTEFVMETLDELKLTTKMLTLTSDSASNNDSLANLLEKELKKCVQEGTISNKKFDGNASHIHCLAHIINLICKEVLKSLKSGSFVEANNILETLNWKEQIESMSVIMKIPSFALYIDRSPNARRKWLQLVEDQSKQFIQMDMDIRWNSTFRMIEDAIKLQHSIHRFIRNEQLFQFAITGSEWD